jgi:CheY-like chemotaxis protein
LTLTLARFTGDKRDRSILVVDDDAAVREILRRSLERDGWRVLEAENGATALEMLASERPAAILLDLMMPVMDGFEFIVNYSQVAEWLSIPVLVLTAKDPTPEERERLERQVVRVLRKGDYTHDELLGEIHRRVDKHLKLQQASGTA